MRYQEKKRARLREVPTTGDISKDEQISPSVSDAADKVILSQDEVRMVSYIRRDAVRVVIALVIVASLYVATSIALRRSSVIASIGARMAVAAGLKAK